MTQYCRYCAFCFEGDGYFCSAKREQNAYLSDDKIRRVNHCKDFVLSQLGDVTTGRPYTPRKGKPLTAYDGCVELEQLSFLEGENENR